MRAAVLASAWLAGLVGLATGDENCTLTQEPPAKPEPSLTQCYRFNALSCCVSGHDSLIQDSYETTFSTNCLREYPELENWFCLGCNPMQYTFVDSQASPPVIRVCRDYADMLFDLDLAKCGILMNVRNKRRHNATLNTPAAQWQPGEYEPSAVKNVVLPKKVFDSSEAFLKNLLPPFFAAYDVQIVEQNDPSCFSSPAAVLRPAMAASALLAALLHALLA